MGEANLAHALQACNDPDCEIHHPEVIETESERMTALAWFFAGAQAMGKMLDDQPDAGLLDLIANHGTEVGG